MIEIKCYLCKVAFGLNDEFYRVAKERADDLSWFCPNGHSQVFRRGPTESELLRKERDTLKQQLAYKDDRIRAEQTQREYAQNQARAYKGVATRVKNRVSNGVCPCCNRTFANLQRHMATKHAGFAETDLPHHGALIQ